ncbi:MAG: FtsQ-type POTRA domain-containing protein [Patescibacteria group bacterium]
MPGNKKSFLAMYKKPYRIKRKKSILKNRFFWSGLLFLVLAGGIIWLVCFAPFFQIKGVNISGCQKVKTQELESAIKSQIVKNMAFFDTQSIFLVNSGKITSEIIKNFPQIEKISVQKNLPDKLAVSVEERKPVALLCQGEKCFLVDKNGAAFEETSEADYQGPKIKSQILLSEIKPGEIVIESNLMAQILKINSKLKDDLKIALQEFDIASEQRLNVRTLGGWEAYFNLKGDIDWQIIELKTILENKIPPGNWGNLDYIDLRFDRVFVSPDGLMSD